ncbi:MULTISPECIES: hypothetical protein [Pseudomonas]|uniref:Lipoprotein n=2 Tax=Pseudomonadaceae TaxID=135621 RepID=A0A0D0JML4_9PSED|nr:MULTISPECIES: hypothetical protein [Pseudomonas]KIP96618.1 hypothetical protein RU08_20350 [Pseudomonas fulva]MCW2291912.1 hypothetical protein [Pseudomonas sp. BIGb0408]NYH73517.1 hypothetical protein [Pseudomonas flavescens]
MKTLMAGLAAALILAGCSHTKPPAPQVPVTGKINPTRVMVTPSDADTEAAKASLFTAIDPRGISFDSLFGTAASRAGDDLAVCGFASRDEQPGALYFAYYNGELLLWDEAAPHGTSTENQFLAMICSYR